MPTLIILDEDGPLGSAGTQVWVDDPADVSPPKKPAKAAAPKKPHAASGGGPDSSES